MAESHTDILGQYNPLVSMTISRLAVHITHARRFELLGGQFEN